MIKRHDELVEVRMKSFQQLLNSIDSVNNEKKTLWLQIYENAVQDRQNAYNNYQELVELCQGKSSEWAVHGRTMTAYLERMNKSNDQLIKLSELVSKSQEPVGESVSSDDIFNKINSRN